MTTASPRNTDNIPLDAQLRARLEAALTGAYDIQRELTGGDMSRVFVARERALGHSGVLPEVPRQREYDVLRSDPRWNKLIERMAWR